MNSQESECSRATLNNLNQLGGTLRNLNVKEGFLHLHHLNNHLQNDLNNKGEPHVTLVISRIQMNYANSQESESP